MNWQDLEAGDTLVHDIDVVTVLMIDPTKDRIDLFFHSDASVYHCTLSKLSPPRKEAVLYKGRKA